MNPNRCAIVLRARSPFEVFDLMLLYIRQNLARFTRLGVVIVGPVWLLCSVLAWWFEGHPAVLLLPLLATPMLQVPFTVLGGHLLFDDDIGVLHSLVLSWHPATWAVVFINSFVGSLVALATLGLGLFVWWPATVFVYDSVLLERAGILRGFKRSQRLAFGQPPAAAVAVFSRVWLSIWGAVVGEAGGQLIVQQGLQLGQPFGSAMDGEVTPYLLAGVLLVQPLHALYRLLLYVDVRTRVEGWDLQVALNSAAQERVA